MGINHEGLRRDIAPVPAPGRLLDVIENVDVKTLSATRLRLLEQKFFLHNALPRGTRRGRPTGRVTLAWGGGGARCLTHVPRR